MPIFLWVIFPFALWSACLEPIAAEATPRARDVDGE
jgi:hypothetical protein